MRSVAPGAGLIAIESRPGEAFVHARLGIINDSTALAGDRLRAMEQLESRALGRPKETVEHHGEENPLRAELLQIPQEERRAWLRRLKGVDEAAEPTCPPSKERFSVTNTTMYVVG